MIERDPLGELAADWCCCSDRMSGGLPCLPGKCPNNPYRIRSIVAAVVVAVAADHAQPGVDSNPAEAGDFGVDPEDSQRLLELRNAIDTYLGWKSPADEEAGDYVARIKEVGDALFEPLSPEARAALNVGLESARKDIEASGTGGKPFTDEESEDIARFTKLVAENRVLRETVDRLTTKNYRQRRELRRLNHAERTRSLAISLAHHQHSVYSDPRAERRRIAHLIWSVAQIMKQYPPAVLTKRSTTETIESLSAWEEWLKSR